MINSTLYLKEMKRNIFLGLIFIGVFLLYGSMIPTMFNPDPTAANIFQQFASQFPDMMRMFGFNIATTDYAEFVAGYLYGFVFIAFPIVFGILLINRLVFRYIDRGSMVYLLTTPNSRKSIIMTQISVIITYFVILTIWIFAVVAISSESKWPGEMRYGALLYLDLSWFIFMLMVTSISFFASASLDGKIASGINIGIPVAFFLFQMIANLGGNYEWFKYLTPFTLFNTEYIVNFETASYINNAVLFIAIALYGLGVWRFTKRDLSI